MTTEIKTGRLPSSFGFLQVLLLLVGLAALAGGVYFWFNAPSAPVSMEGGLRPVGFSLGLDDAAVSRLDRAGDRSFWKGPARVYANGYAAGVGKVWSELERAPQDPALAMVKVIPSGGLYPYYRSSTFAEDIKAFVRGGGSLICFGQPLGAMYRALPESPAGVGWAEVSAEAREAYGTLSVNADHPALAALNKSEFKAHFAGFFTAIPGTDQTVILLRDGESGQPVVVAYRYGRGLVIATALVSDAAAVGTSLSVDEKALLNGLLSWAWTGLASLPQFDPNDQIEMDYPLPGGSGAAADGFVQIYQPDGVMDRSFQVNLPVEGDNYVSQPYQVTAPKGIWRTVSYLRDAGGNAVGPAASTWFAVGHAPAAAPLSGFRASVVLPGTQLVSGSAVQIAVHLWNYDAAPTEITYRGPAGKRTTKLAAGQHKVFYEEMALLGDAIKPIVYEFYGPDGGKLTEIRRRVVGGQPDRVYLSLTGPAAAGGGQVVNFSLAALSINPGQYTADCWARLVRNGEILWQEPRRGLKLNGAYSAKETIKVPMPSVRGRYVLEVSLTQNGRDLASAWTEINLE